MKPDHTLSKYVPAEFESEEYYRIYQRINLAYSHLSNLIDIFEENSDIFLDKISKLENKNIRLLCDYREPIRIKKLNDLVDEYNHHINIVSRFKTCLTDLYAIIEKPFDYDLNKVYDLCKDNGWIDFV